MSDDKSKTDNRDRSRVSGSEDYEVDHFARRHGITHAQARSLIEAHGNDRETLDMLAERIGASGRSPSGGV